MNDTCEWKEKIKDFYDTSCGHSCGKNSFKIIFSLIYCPYCGKKIKLEDEQ